MEENFDEQPGYPDVHEIIEERIVLVFLKKGKRRSFFFLGLAHLSVLEPLHQEYRNVNRHRRECWRMIDEVGDAEIHVQRQLNRVVVKDPDGTNAFPGFEILTERKHRNWTLNSGVHEDLRRMLTILVSEQSLTSKALCSNWIKNDPILESLL